MEIVINIPDKEYEEIIDNKLNKSWDMTHYERVIANGISLPKGHGKLIDASEVVKAYAFEKKTNALNGDDDAFIEAINHAPTIIEADKR